jgi:transcriptional regulator with XRE-family HTH domain
MIRNEREYRITKAQAKAFAETLAALRQSPAPADVHPLLAQAEVDAVTSQLEDLREQLREYETLRDETAQLSVTSFDDLPTALIKARIARGINQKELAQKIGVAEQQIQRYEATNYKGASIDRINEIVKALNIRVHKSFYLPTSVPTANSLFARADELGIERHFLLSKLLTPQDRATIENADIYADDDAVAFASATSTLDRIFQLPQGAFLGAEPPTLRAGTAQFKLPSRLGKSFTAYTAYAYYLARVVLNAYPAEQARPPADPATFRSGVIEKYGRLALDTVLHYIWDLGIPVLPLHYRGAFHGACWREEHRHVIVLKQRTPSVARWLLDLIHESRHTTQHPNEADFTVVETGDNPLERAKNRDEQEATEFAMSVIFGGRQEELADEAVEEAGGKLEWLKRAAVTVANRRNVDVDAFANYLAYRLSEQGENWWGAATNLQRRDEDPWAVARDIFCQRMDFATMTETDRALLHQALQP